MTTESCNEHKAVEARVGTGVMLGYADVQLQGLAAGERGVSGQ